MTTSPETSLLAGKQFDPFNISIMRLTPDRLQRVGRVTSVETYDGARSNLHPLGLFSPVIFGLVGTPERDYTFGQIKLNTRIIHPLIMSYLTKMKKLNGRIWRGEAFARFDEKLGEFIETDIENGDTGYHFFMKHCLKMKFKKNKSARRNNMVDILNQDRTSWFMEHHLVLPAGLRDLMEEKSGKITEDEINEYYRKLIRLSNGLEALPKKETPELDSIRVQMQNTADDIYLYIKSLLTGKGGFLLKKWASRTVHMGSRNVISSQDPSCNILDESDMITSDHVQMGLFQSAYSCKYIVYNCLINSDVIKASFPQKSTTAFLINPVTLKREAIEVDNDDIDDWVTLAGIEKQLKRFENISVRVAPITVRGHYLGLVYDHDNKILIVNDIDELPAKYNRRHVRPLTMVELLYIYCEPSLNGLPVQITRYPVTGDESTYIGELLVKTTTTGLRKYYLNGNDELKLFREYPDLSNPIFHDTTTISSTRVQGLGGDFDGDMVSCNILTTTEAIEEYHRLKFTRKSIIRPNGKLAYSVNTDIVNRTIYALTSPIDETKRNRSIRG